MSGIGVLQGSLPNELMAHRARTTLPLTRCLFSQEQQICAQCSQVSSIKHKLQGHLELRQAHCAAPRGWAGLTWEDVVWRDFYLLSAVKLVTWCIYIWRPWGCQMLTWTYYGHGIWLRLAGVILLCYVSICALAWQSYEAITLHWNTCQVTTLGSSLQVISSK